jgi:hypothetical protein
MHTKLLISCLVLVALVAGVGIYQSYNQPIESVATNTQATTTAATFSELGYITQRAPSYINETLVFTYEEPGAPALTVKLVFNEQSHCQFEEQGIQCMALSNPLINIVKDKRVFVEGTKDGDTVTVQTLALDLEANRTFGYIKKVVKNGVNALVTIDEIEFLSGDEAVQAVMKDFACEKSKVEECVPSMNNDFYIRNMSTSTEVYNLTADTKIRVFKNPGSPELEDVSLTSFIARSKDKYSLILISPFTFVAEDATITHLEQQYTP